MPIGINKVLRNSQTGSVIPDSAILNYDGDTWSQGDSSWTDGGGNANMSLNGDFQKSTLSDGEPSIVGDGTNDYGLITMPSELEGSSLNAFAIEFSIQYTSNSEAYVLGSWNDLNQKLQINLDTNAAGSTDNGNIQFRLDDSNGNQLRFGPSSNPNLDDGSRHDVTFIINDASTNDVKIIIDESSVSVTVDVSQSPSTFTTWDNPMAVWARWLDTFYTGDVGDWAAAGIGVMRWHDEAITSQTIGSGGGGTTETDPSTTYATISLSTTDPKAIDITGNYAVVVGKGMSIVDISNPESPSEVGTLSETTLPNEYGIAIDSDYAYVASMQDENLKAVDISNKTAPNVADSVTTSSRARKVWIEGTDAFVTTDDSLSGDDPLFHSIDVSDPTNMTIQDTVNDTSLSYSFELAVAGTTAIVCARGGNQLAFIDVSNPTALSTAGTYTNADLNYPYGIVIDTNDSEAFVTCAETDDRVVALDVSTPTSPSQLGSFGSSETNHLYGIDLYNNGDMIAVSARDSNDVTTIDVSDPTTMNQVGSVSTGTATYGPYDSAVSGEYTFSCTRSNDELIVSGTQ